MAINNTAVLSPAIGGIYFPASFENESVSFDSVLGENASFRTISAGAPLILNSMRAVNGDVLARDISFLLVDGDGITHGHMSMNGLDRVSVPSGHAAVWNGAMLVPAGFRVYAKWFSMSPGHRCNWQYTGWRPALSANR